MIDHTTKQDLLEKILESKEFCGSKIYKSYLTYLVEATEEGKELKETTIAMEAFGKDAHFNPAEDTIVRSHTYNLRKKLETYYYDEGKNDKYRLEIPKGHYEAVFLPSEKRGPTYTGVIDFIRKRYRLVLIAVLLVFAGYLSYKTWMLEQSLKDYKIIDEADPLWSDYLQSELPILIAVGDHFFFDEHDSKYNDVIAIRHGKINSMEDFEELRALYPDIQLEPTAEPYFPYHSIWSLPPILSILHSANKKPILRKSSALSPQMLDEYNMIFLGSIKTMYILRHTLEKSNFRFQISPHKVFYTTPDSNSAQSFNTSLHSAGPNDDLVLAVKLPGPKDNFIFVIASFHSLGAPEIATYLTESSTRLYLENLLREKYGEVPKYFEILFRVTGIDKTAYNTEILVCNAIPSE